MTNRWFIILLAITALSAIVFRAGWHVGTREAEAKYDGVQLADGYDMDTPAASVDIPKLEKLALESCRCDTTEGTSRDKNCWKQFDNEISKYAKISSYATACAPISTSSDCIATDDGEKCFTTDFGIKGICTNEEARAAENAWNDAYKQAEEDGASEPDVLANNAMKRVVERIQRGEVITAGGSSRGCSG